MKYHIDRKIRLVTEPKYKNLYTRALQEIDENGEPVSDDLIPWEWDSYFSATNLTFSSQFSVFDGREEHRTVLSPEEREVRHTSWIHAYLTPDRHATSYQMFGTDRYVKHFGLHIEVLSDETQEEALVATGGVSYTTNEGETAEDFIDFHLLLRPSTFERYVRRIDAGADGLILRARHVHGFYARWSPEITTPLIKVLASGDQHEIEVPDGADSFGISRMGTVGDFSLTIWKEAKFGSNKH